MLLLIAIVLLVLWLLGFLLFHLAGFLLHLLIPVALIFLVWHLIKGKS
jgi:hypothetical protein